MGQGLAPTTVHKRLQFARQFFRMARRHRLIDENPFDEIRHKAGVQKDRQRFITPAETAKVLEACPSRDWRLIVALARYGGLRCPSEVLSLRWDDVNWADDRMVVTSPKTEHHPGKGSRQCPLPRATADPDRSFRGGPRGARLHSCRAIPERVPGSDGWRNTNLRTTFEKIIRRAG